MWPYFGGLLFSLPVFIIYLLGAQRHFFNGEKNTCGMTYMFERPEYVRIQLHEEIQSQFPRYGLYVYGEGFTVSKIQTMRFSGIPILFIPGNAGSHQQVRSLASVSLRKSMENQVPFHFDFFTVDLHEEYSALYGGVLAEQTAFVSHCIQKILKFYANKIDSVVLIGHSMGGIVSKGVLLEPTVNITQVNTIIMLATPHTAALVLDRSIASIYRKLEESEKLFKESEIVTISVGGGPNDMVVNSNQVMDRTADLNVLTTHIPGVWKTMDHLSILWCKEFVLSTVRALFDSVDTTGRYPRISSNKDYRLKVFNYHFLQRSAGKKMGRYQTKVQFEPDGEWIEDIRRQYTWKPSNEIGATNKLPLYLMIRLIGRQDRLTIHTKNLDARDWLFACSASAIHGHSRVCEWGWNLTNKSQIHPDSTRRRRIADFDLGELKARRLTHVVIRVLPNDINRRLSIGVDLHLKSDRIKKMENKFSFFGKLGEVESSIGTILHEVNLDNDTDSVWLKMTKVECTQRNYLHSATVELLEAWTNNVSQAKLFTYQDMTPKMLKVQTKRDMNRNEAFTGGVAPKLKFTLDPECAYTIEVWQGGLMETLASTVRDRWSNLYGVIVGLLLLALAEQVDHGMGFINSTVARIVTFALCFGIGILAEGFAALAILHLFAALVCIAVVLFGSTASSVAHRFLARALKFSDTWSEWILGGLIQLPLLTATILLSLIPVTCGALAMLLFIALQFLKLVKVYEDCLDELLLSSLRFTFINSFRKRSEKEESKEQDESESDGDKKQIGFLLVLFLVWCAAAMPAIPSVLVWAKNYRYNARLATEDPFLMACWVIFVGCGSAGVTWIPPSIPGYYSKEIGGILRLLGWTALTVTGVGYPDQYQYLMPPLIAVAIGFLMLNPIIGSPTMMKR